MNNNDKTAAMLQRVPKILAVTAGSYGLTLQGPRESDHPRRMPEAPAGQSASAGHPKAAQR